MERRLVSVRKAKLVLPLIGDSSRRLVLVDAFQVPVAANKKIKPGDLVLLIKANTFLPSHIAEFAEFKPQIKWGDISGFVVQKVPPLIVNNKKQASFDGILMPVSDFPEIARHISLNMNRYSSDDALLTALRQTDTFTKYLEVVEYKPASGTSQSNNSKLTTLGRFAGKGLAVLQPCPSATAPTNGPSHKESKHSIIGFRPPFCRKIDMINAEDIDSLFYPQNLNTLYSITTFMVGSPMSVYFIHRSSRHAALVRRAAPAPAYAGASGGRVGVCSRTLDLHQHGAQHPAQWAAARRLDLPRRLASLGRSVVVHGVLCGAGVRDDYEDLPAGDGGEPGPGRRHHRFFAYAVLEVDGEEEDGGGSAAVGPGRLVPPGRLTWELLARMGVESVPHHDGEEGVPVRMRDVARSQEELRALADGPGLYVQKRAGLVFRNVKSGRAFKVMSGEYIRRYGVRAIRNETQDRRAHKTE